LKDLTPGKARTVLREQPTIIVPIGGIAATASHLPLGSDSLIVQRLADDLSSARRLACAPVLEYSVYPVQCSRDGGVGLRRKTLHRVMNELIDSWEDGAGIRRFIVLTAVGNDAQLEALSTVRTEIAQLTTIDVLGFDLGTLLTTSSTAEQTGELATSLLLHIAPDLVNGEPSSSSPGASTDAFLRGARAASAERAGELYNAVLERILHLVDAAHTEVR
jgi:creatinine amidohydrolase/Fe(II)-dependent formamide hydrolase-like protein